MYQSKLLLWITSLFVFTQIALVRGQCGGNELLRDKLILGCPTAKAFCERILSGSIPPPATVQATTTKFLTSTTSTRFLDATTSYVKKTKAMIYTTKVATLFRGASTKTVTGCNTIETCGAFHGPGGANLRDACTCVKGRSTKTTGTYTYTRAYPTTTVYSRTYMTTTPITAHTTTVITVESTRPVVTSYICSTTAPPSHGCKNSGHEWALFGLTPVDKKRPVYRWKIDQYKHRTPLQNGTASLLGALFLNPSFNGKGDYPTDITLNSCNGLYGNDRGYIFTPNTGTYKFTIPAYYQAAYMWLGQKAVSNYNISNADLAAIATNNIQNGGPSVLIHLEGGRYYPFRFVWRCVSNSFDFWVQVVSPDGHIMFGEYAPYLRYDDYGDFKNNDGFVRIFSPYVIRYGCGADSALAPPFPDWGSE